jgi:hypothetical protein
LQILESKSILFPTVGLTWDVPFTPMEVKATTPIAAAQANNAEVDLLTWALPGETIKQACSRDVLRRFAVRWWATNLLKEAMRWWKSNGKDPKDLEAIQNCIFQARACSYWHWHQGSRFSFGDSPKNFKLKCKMGFPFITFVLPLGDMLIIHRPHQEGQRSNAERKCFN